MKAIAQDRYGSSDALELREFDRPVPTGNQVLVRVEAVSLNAYDWHHLRGDPYMARLAFGVHRPGRRSWGGTSRGGSRRSAPT